MNSMRVVQVARAGAPFELVSRPVPIPGAGQVRVRVEACGICHSDSFTKEGGFPGVSYPRVPGHEIVGTVDAVGSSVPDWQPGTRVGIGWHGGHCGHCNSCRRGDFITCDAHLIPGITFDGGYADYLVAPYEALATVPEGLSSAEAAPLLCAGITTFNALRHSGARAGDLVAVLGIGGLGHLGVQFAAQMGFRTVAIARGTDKEALARSLGASEYVDSTRVDVGSALLKLGGAQLVLSTVTHAKSITAALGGLAVGGKLLIVGAAMEPMEIPPVALIGRRTSIQGWPSGTSRDSEDTLRFSLLANVRPRIEAFPLERAAEAYERMLSGAARFRVVLTTGAGSSGPRDR